MNELNIPARPPGRVGLEAWYREVFAHQSGSGKSIATLSAELGVTTSTLYQWKRRLSDSAARDDAAQSPSRGLVEISVAGSPHSAGQPEFVVRLCGGHHIEVPATFDASALKRLVSTLETC